MANKNNADREINVLWRAPRECRDSQSQKKWSVWRSSNRRLQFTEQNEQQQCIEIATVEHSTELDGDIIGKHHALVGVGVETEGADLIPHAETRQ